MFSNWLLWVKPRYNKTEFHVAFFPLNVQTPFSLLTEISRCCRGLKMCVYHLLLDVNLGARKRTEGGITFSFRMFVFKLYTFILVDK